MDFFIKQKNLAITVGTIMCFFVLILFLGFGVPSKFPTGEMVSIDEGQSLRSISKNFKSEHLIKSRAVFEFLIIVFGAEKNILPGDYKFDQRVGVFEVAKAIREGNRYKVQVKLTIPEGFNNTEIAEIADLKLPKFNKDNFLKLSLAKQGYLFPDTYFFFSSANEKEVFEYMLSNFERKTKEIRAEIISMQKNEKEILTMASILEREASGDLDRATISGILWKRLSIGMALQVDAWPATYKKPGLPESPISNPGLEAIHSALYPKSSQYLYYLHDKEGMIHYARTYTEHRANIDKYLR